MGNAQVKSHEAYSNQEYEKALEYIEHDIKKRGPTADNMSDKGVYLFELNRHEEATEAFDQALRLDPNEPNAYEKKASSLVAQGKFGEAEPLFDKALELSQHHTDALYGKAFCQVNCRKYEEALPNLEQVIQKQPDNSGALNNKGYCLMELGQVDEALNFFDKALAKNKKYPEALNNKGTALAWKNQYEESVRVFEKSIKIRKDYDSIAYQGKAHSLMKLERYDEALETLRQAKNIPSLGTSSLVAVLLNTTSCLYKQGKYDEGFDTVAEVFDLDSTNSEAHLRRGILYFHKGEFNKAIDDFHAAQECGEMVTQATYWIAVCQLNLRQYHGALANFETAERRNCKFPCDFGIGRALVMVRKYTKAKERLEKALQNEDDKRKGEIYSSLSLVMIGMHRYDEAISYTEQAISIAPKLSEPFRVKATALNLQRKHLAAKEVVSVALQKDSEDPMALSEKAYAVAALELKEPKEAEQSLEKGKLIFGADDNHMADLLCNLAFIKYITEQWEEAIDYASRSLSIEEHLPWAHVYRALTLMQQKHHTEALEEFACAKQKGLRVKESLIEEARCLYEIEWNEEALDVLNEVLKLDPKNKNANYYAAFIYKDHGNYEKAVECFDAVLSEDPDDIEVLVEKGYLLAKLEHYNYSLTAFESILQQHPKDERGLMGKGAVLNRLQRPEEAKACLLEARVNGASGNTLCHELYLSHFELKAYEDAASEMDRVLVENSYDEFALYRKGLALMEQGKIEDATELFKIVLSLDEGHARSMIALGQCYNSSGQFLEAKRILQTALDRDMNTSQCFLELGKTFYFLNEYEEALRHLKQSTKVNSDNMDARYYTGVTLMASKNYSHAIKEFEQILRADPQSFAPKIQMATSLMHMDNYEQAIRLIGELESEVNVQELPQQDAVQAFRTKGFSLHQLENYAESAQYFDKAISIDDSDPMSFYCRGFARSCQGDHKGALHDFDAAASLDDNFPCTLERTTELIVLRRYEDARKLVVPETKRENSDSYVLLARALNGLHSHGAALEMATKAITVKPENLEGYYAKAYAENRSRKFSQALETVNLGLSDRRQDSRLLSEKAFALAALKEGNALETISSAIELETNSFRLSDFYSNKAYVFLTRCEYQDAINAATQSIDLDPAIDWAYYYRGSAYFELEKQDQAEEDFYHAHENGMPYSGDNVLLEAIGLYKRGNFDESLNLLFKVVDSNPDNARAHYYIALNKIKLDDYVQAIEHLNRATEVDSGFSEAFVEKGHIQLKLGNPSKALESCQSALQYKSSYSGYFLKGCCLQMLKEYKGAVKSFDKSLRLEDEHTESWYKKGECLIMLNDLNKAEVALTRALKVNPRHANSLKALGDVNCSKDDFEQASEYYCKALEADANHAGAYAGRGYCKMQNLEYEAALDDFVSSGELEETAKVHYYMGFCLFKLGRLSKATTVFQHCLRLDPNHFRACRDAARCLHQSEKYDQELKFHEQAVALQPDNPNAYLARAQCLIKLKRYHEALESLDTTLELKPKFRSALRDKAECLNKMGEYQRCIDIVDMVLDEIPDNPTLWGLKANALFFSRRYKDAITCFDKALSLRPNFAEALSNKGACLNELGKYEEALACLEKAVSLKPNFAEAYCNLGNAYVGLNKNEDACQVLDTSISLNGSSPMTFNNKGNALLNLGRFKEAITSYDKALELNPDQPIVLTNKAFCFVELGWYARTLKAADSAIELDPEYTEAYGIKGVALNHMGRHRQAIECLDIVLKKNPRSTQALVQKGYACFETSKYKEAIHYFDKALKIDSTLENARRWRHAATQRL